MPIARTLVGTALGLSRLVALPAQAADDSIGFLPTPAPEPSTWARGSAALAWSRCVRESADRR